MKSIDSIKKIFADYSIFMNSMILMYFKKSSEKDLDFGIVANILILLVNRYIQFIYSDTTDITKYMKMSNVEISRLTSTPEKQIPKVAKFLVDRELIKVKKTPNNINTVWVNLDKVNELMIHAKDNYELVLIENEEKKREVRFNKAKTYQNNKANCNGGKSKEKIEKKADKDFEKLQSIAHNLVENKDSLSEEELNTIMESSKKELGYYYGDIQLMCNLIMDWKELYNSVLSINRADFNTIRKCFVENKENFSTYILDESKKQRLRIALEELSIYESKKEYFGSKVAEFLKGKIYKKEIQSIDDIKQCA